MKVISLLQPWATLVVIGAKKIETRSWNTKYRGEILIHASAGKNKDGHNLWHQQDCWEKFPQVSGMHFAQLPFGAILGQVNLIDTDRTDQICFMDEIQRGEHHWNISEQELAFGDYSEGRYGWMLAEAIQFAIPIPAKGSLSIWNYELENLPEVI